MTVNRRLDSLERRGGLERRGSNGRVPADRSDFFMQVDALAAELRALPRESWDEYLEQRRGPDERQPATEPT